MHVQSVLHLVLTTVRLDPLTLSRMEQISKTAEWMKEYPAGDEIFKFFLILH